MFIAGSSATCRTPLGVRCLQCAPWEVRGCKQATPKGVPRVVLDGGSKHCTPKGALRDHLNTPTQ
jgi:hypothetical protein